MAAGNEISINWVPAHNRVEGNEFADDLNKEEAEGSLSYNVSDEVRWQASLPHLSRRASEGRARQTPEWAASHVGPERRCRPLAAQGFATRPCGGCGRPWLDAISSCFQAMPRRNRVLPRIRGDDRSPSFGVE